MAIARSSPPPPHLPLGFAVERPAGVPGLDLDAALPQVVGHLLLAHGRERLELLEKLLKATQGFKVN